MRVSYYGSTRFGLHHTNNLLHIPDTCLWIACEPPGQLQFVTARGGAEGFHEGDHQDKTQERGYQNNYMRQETRSTKAGRCITLTSPTENRQFLDPSDHIDVIWPYSVRIVFIP
jgi:hypothetical protein